MIDSRAYAYGSHEILRQINADCIPSQTGTLICVDCDAEFPVYEHECDTNENGYPLCPSCAGWGMLP